MAPPNRTDLVLYAILAIPVAIWDRFKWWVETSEVVGFPTELANKQITAIVTNTAHVGLLMSRLLQ